MLKQLIEGVRLAALAVSRSRYGIASVRLPRPVPGTRRLEAFPTSRTTQVNVITKSAGLAPGGREADTWQISSALNGTPGWIAIALGEPVRISLNLPDGSTRPSTRYKSRTCHRARHGRPSAAGRRRSSRPDVQALGRSTVPARERPAHDCPSCPPPTPSRSGSCRRSPAGPGSRTSVASRVYPEIPRGGDPRGASVRAALSDVRGAIGNRTRKSGRLPAPRRSGDGRARRGYLARRATSRIVLRGEGGTPITVGDVRGGVSKCRGAGDGPRRHDGDHRGLRALRR